MKDFLRGLYRLFPAYFNEFMVEDLIGEIPESIAEPSISFLAQGRVKIEKWLLFQSYYLQRRAVGDIKNAQLYQGMLMYIKILLTVVNQTVINKKDPYVIKIEETKDPLRGVNEFMEGFKDLTKKDEEVTI